MLTAIIDFLMSTWKQNTYTKHLQNAFQGLTNEVYYDSHFRTPGVFLNSASWSTLHENRYRKACRKYTHRHLAIIV